MVLAIVAVVVWRKRAKKRFVKLRYLVDQTVCSYPVDILSSVDSAVFVLEIPSS